jgi:hypothetical protein
MTTYDLVITIDGDDIFEEDLTEADLRDELAERGYTSPAAEAMPIGAVMHQVTELYEEVEIYAYDDED